jgi:hypothetical protein
LFFIIVFNSYYPSITLHTSHEILTQPGYKREINVGGGIGRGRAKITRDKTGFMWSDKTTAHPIAEPLSEILTSNPLLKPLLDILIRKKASALTDQK